MRNGIWGSFDWGLIIPTLVLVSFSLVTLSSISTEFFRSQIINVIVGVFVFFFFLNVNLRALQGYSLHIYVTSIIVFLVVLVIGVESRGAVRWIDIFGIRIQFSEIFKPFLAVSFASYLGNRGISAKTLLTSLLFILPICFLIFAQPDLGNAIIYGLVSFSLLFVAGFSLLWFIAGLLIVSAISPILWFFLRNYQKQRIVSFVNPGSDPLGSSYNAIQSVIAVGSGMIFGKGYGQGTQSLLQFLPERHTDFIFATLSEEFGFIGSVIVITSFVFLFYRVYILFVESENLQYKLFCACAFFLLLFQFFFNTGMNMGILPIVGVTLPFVSYGGSSIVSGAVFLGLLSSISRELKRIKMLEIR